MAQRSPVLGASSPCALPKQSFNLLYIRIGRDDLKASAVIRDTAIALFAERGPAGVSVREIAAGAGVSPGLVIHHFGSKEGLKAAVDDHVAEVLDDLLAEMGGPEAPDATSLSEAFVKVLERELGLLDYVRRLLFDGGEPGRQLFGRLQDVTQAGLAALVRAGVVRASGDETVRAAFLLANDLALVLLRRQIEAVLGFDPLGHEGLVRWSAAVLDVYSHGVFTGPTPEPATKGKRR